ncbi:MAG: hypothetical protein ACTHZO_02790 [Moraxellaceae bacterium]|uniref:hypothetical protein n=1 Tax=Psychrobacter sp. TaxID=56811 RepID=UPI003F986DD9
MKMATASLAYSSMQHHTSAHLAFPQREKSNRDFNGFQRLMQASVRQDICDDLSLTGHFC